MQVYQNPIWAFNTSDSCLDKKDLQNLSDPTLVDFTLSLIKSERARLITFLHYLAEIDRRKLFSSLRYKSLYDFCIHHLHLSEDQAYRRISAMKILREMPEFEAQMHSGELSLTHMGLAHSFLQKEVKVSGRPLTADKKREILSGICGKTTREAEHLLLSLSSSPSQIPSDTIRPLTEDLVEIRLSVTKEIQEKIVSLRGLLAHQQPCITLGELFEYLCDLGIEHLTQSTPQMPSAAPQKRRVNASNEFSKLQASMPLIKTLQPLPRVTLRHQVFKKARYKCENCESTYALEVDHILPRSVGGSSHPQNLRLLCRSCNQRAAIQFFGPKKMEAHLKPPPAR